MSTIVKPTIAESDAQILACYTVMRELRTHLDEGSFLARVRSQEESGYRIAYVAEDASPVAVAGFRISESLAWGRFLYVDDLVTLPGSRSRGFGGLLLRWLRERAAASGCNQLHLDSGVQKKEAHRFYEHESMKCSSYHFSMKWP